MSDSSRGRRRVAGYNQFSKLVRRGKAVKVYLANDADVYFANRIKSELSNSECVELITRYNSNELAAMAGVDVPTAVITEAES
jgi:ribosomal protein L7Ae-like RNA K-turn-binding protein